MLETCVSSRHRTDADAGLVFRGLLRRICRLRFESATVSGRVAPDKNMRDKAIPEIFPQTPLAIREISRKNGRIGELRAGWPLKSGLVLDLGSVRGAILLNAER